MDQWDGPSRRNSWIMSSESSAPFDTDIKRKIGVVLDDKCRSVVIQVWELTVVVAASSNRNAHADL